MKGWWEKEYEFVDGFIWLIKKVKKKGRKGGREKEKYIFSQSKNGNMQEENKPL